MTDLLPCPFCGGVKLSVFPPNCKEDDEYDPGDNAQPIVRCYTCFAEVMGDTWDHGMKTALAAWNRRAPVKVRELKWVQIGSSYRAAAPLFGSIRVEDYASGKWIILWSAPGICDTFTPGAYATPEAAKAAAQADYTARILAAIEVPS